MTEAHTIDVAERTLMSTTLRGLAEELDGIEAAGREQDQIAAEEARRRQEQLDKLRGDLGN